MFLFQVSKILAEVISLETLYFFPLMEQSSSGPRLLYYREFMITHRHTTVGGAPLDKWSARRRDLHLTTRNNHNRRISMPPLWLETTVSAGERPQTHALDHAANGTGI